MTSARQHRTEPSGRSAVSAAPSDESRAAAREGSRQEDERRAHTLARAFGYHGLCHVGAASDKELFFAARGDGAVAYSIVRDVVIALGDPIAPPHRLGEVALELRAFARDHGARALAFFSTTERAAGALDRAGFRSLAIGSEPIIDLASFDLAGGARKSLRQAYHRGIRQGVEWREYARDAARRADWEADIAELDAAWTRAHGGESRQRLTDIPLDRTVPGVSRTFVALCGGRVVAVSMVTPVPARRAHYLHLARRHPLAPHGAMEVLDVGTLRALADEGAELVLFGLCPLHHALEGHTLLSALAARMAKRLAGVYDTSGLTAYKAKFGPSAWEPRFLTFAPEGATRRVIAALLQAQVAGGFGTLVREALRAPPTRRVRAGVQST